MTPQESHQEAIEYCHRRNALRVYNQMKKQTKSVWWAKNGVKGCYYRRFIGEGNFERLMSYFRVFNNE